MIPIHALREILRDPRLANIPAILESPEYYPGHRHTQPTASSSTISPSRTPRRSSHHRKISEQEQKRQRNELEYLHRIIHCPDELWEQWSTPLQEGYRLTKRLCEKRIRRAIVALGEGNKDKLRKAREGVNRATWQAAQARRRSGEHKASRRGTSAGV